MQQWQQNEAERLILPALEACYLRHHNGLDLIRRWLDWLWGTSKPVVVVVDSWAWRYLQQIYHLQALNHRPLTLAPLQATDLDRWFYLLAHQQARHAFTFRQEQRGTPVLRSSLDSDEKPSEFLRHLAARSRGIPGVAQAIWRHALQVAASEVKGKSAQQKAATDQGITLWVTAWGEIGAARCRPRT